MDFRILFKRIFDRIRRPVKAAKNESGIALFMVIAAMTILSVIVSEFTYVAQVNSRMAVDSVDSIKAHYLAKTGLKISLLRLRAYMTLRNFSKQQGGNGGGGFKLPADLLEKVWSFPFVFPIPATLPGLTPTMKDEIKKFEEESALAGKFSATIESDSTRFNLNTLLEDFAGKPTASPSPSPSPDEDGNIPPPPPRTRASPSPSPSASAYDIQKAREAFKQTLRDLMVEKAKEDPDFETEYRDFDIEEFYDNLLGWIDYSYQTQNRSGRQVVPYKRAPFYHFSELMMIHPMDDGMYKIFSDRFTSGMSTGINVNTMQEPILRSLFPNATDEEIAEFFKFRDSEEEDNRFKDEAGFWKYVTQSFASLRGDSSEAEKVKTGLAERGLRLVIDEESFKIRVVAEVNGASRVIEAWVTIQEPKRDTSSRSRRRNTTQPAPSPSPGQDDESVAGPAENSDSGLRITFMRES